ncbi:sigma-70 family RNA polymerase sigma factor [Actinokineospora globicatena]|uniref:RNA polymerase sigma factor 70 region 4 type 2 domain-containing protein n=1 Tax=Actinokineospora globicatena TaxID=103729 RepID=A0A9W6QN64_9PSEU|nr:RNA polymerase sigma factor [Actinokineospora globicatena]GLW91619.1 hypothetical protein Aglo03_24350 [Actinokineospora globicatena]
MTTSDPPPVPPRGAALLANTLLAGIGGLYLTTGSETVTLTATLVVAAIVVYAIGSARTASTRKDDGVDPAYEEFYASWYPNLVAVLIGTGYQQQIAEDAANEAMAALLDHWDEIDNPKAWTITVAKRHAGPAPLDGPPDSEPARGDWSTGVDTMVTVEAMVTRLPPKQREALLLTMTGLSPEEIAQHLGVPSTRVRANLKLARRKMHDYLNERTAD